jgi:hypothetical protein
VPKKTRRARPPTPSNPRGATGDGRLGLVGEDAQLGLAVGLEGAVAVQVVLGDVEQDGGVGRERLRVLELERRRLADHHGTGRKRPGQRRERRADVPRDHHRQPGLAVHMADELDRRGLAVRARDGHEGVLQQPPADLELAEHRQAALPGRRDDGRLGRHPRALGEPAGAAQRLEAVRLSPDRHAGRLERPARRLGRVAGVTPGDVDPPLAQGERRRDARPRQPDHEAWARGQAGAIGHGTAERVHPRIEREGPDGPGGSGGRHRGEPQPRPRVGAGRRRTRRRASNAGGDLAGVAKRGGTDRAVGLLHAVGARPSACGMKRWLSVRGVDVGPARGTAT